MCRLFRIRLYISKKSMIGDMNENVATHAANPMFRVLASINPKSLLNGSSFSKYVHVADGPFSALPPALTPLPEKSKSLCYIAAIRFTAFFRFHAFLYKTG